MKVTIKPSDLQYLYKRHKAAREQPRFTGLPDPHPFDRDDLHEVIPLLEVLMAALDSRDGEVLQEAERTMIYDLPRFMISREEVFQCLYEVMSQRLGQRRA